VIYFIGQAAHHLTFIGVLKTPFKHYLMVSNKHNFSLQYDIKALASGCKLFKLANENCWESKSERGWI
jgi:hypothetical protein